MTQSQPKKTGASESVDTTKGESQVSPTLGSSQTTRSESRASPRDPTEELPLKHTALTSFSKLRQTSTIGGFVDPLSDAHDWFAQETEVTADRLSTRATESTEPGDKDYPVL